MRRRIAAVLAANLLILTGTGFGHASVFAQDTEENLAEAGRNTPAAQSSSENAGKIGLVGLDGNTGKEKSDRIETPETESQQADTEKKTSLNGKKVAIDPGHQGSWVDMSELEPSAPGSSEMKAKATTGTQGVYSNLCEYELTLGVSLVLRDELEERGYEVVMTREDNDKAISNMERALLAAEEGADVLVRIHANGSEDHSVNGALAMVPSQDNPYVSYMFDECYALGEDILNAFCADTGIGNLGVQYYDNMSGINWSTIPVTILEMGFMSNEHDDLLMADESFWPVMADGIADGIDDYFGITEENGIAEAADENTDEKKDARDLGDEGHSETEASAKMAELSNMLAESLAVKASPGESWAAAVVDLTDGSSCVVNDGPMQAASLIKLYIMGAVYERYDALTETYGAEQMENLLYNMITVSDNSAANTLTNYLGGGDDAAGREVVNTYCTQNGYDKTTMGRMLLAPTDNGDNITAVSDCSEFLRRAYAGEMDHAEDVIYLLKSQQRTHKIPAGIPQGIETGNKTGELDTVENDAAIIFGETPYVLCVMSANLAGTGEAQTDIANLSSEVYGFMEAQR